MMLEIQNLHVFYGKAESLHGVSLNVEAGKIIAIIGPVGAGKSTLFDAIFGLNTWTGSITFEGTDLSKRTSANIVKMGISYAPERGNLFTQMNVRDNLLTGAYTAHQQVARNLEVVYELFPILKERESQEVSTQSGGERQMVSLGRALMTNPRLLLVDEPTIGLSPKVSLDIAAALTRLNREFGLTIVIAEQNANFTLSLAEQIVLMEAGNVIRTGTQEEMRQEHVIRESYFGGME